jgi:hypothetical protein
MLALLLALASDCAGLVPQLPPPVQIGAGAATDECFLDGAPDGSGNFALFHSGSYAIFAANGTLLAQLAQAPSIGVPLARGWANQKGATLSVIAPDGTVVGTAPFPGGTVFADPRGIAVISFQAGPTGWEVDLSHYSDHAVLLDGPIPLHVSHGTPPPSYWWFSAVARDGSIVLATIGQFVPPLRNNQFVARWFGPDGTPRTPWFVAADQVTDSFGLRLPLTGGGFALDSNGAPTVIHAGSTATSKPPWPDQPSSNFLISTALADRTAVIRDTLDPCETAIDVYSPSNAFCGTVHIPLPTEPSGNCELLPLHVAADGSVLQEHAVGAPGCSYRSWPKLLAPR